MKNIIRISGIITLTLVIAFSIAACSEADDTTTPPDGNPQPQSPELPGTVPGEPGQPSPTLRYETVPYSGNSASSSGGNTNLVYSARDNTNNYYLFLLGHVKYVPLAYRPAIIYDGQTAQTISYSRSDVSSESISRSVTEAHSHSVTNSVTLGWNVTTEVGVEAGVNGGWFAAKVSSSISTSLSGSDILETMKTRSVANTYETASSWTTEKNDTNSMTIGNNNEPPGKYRYSLFSTSDVYYVLVTDRARTQVIRAYTVVSARAQSLAWGKDYEPDMGGSFEKTAPGALLEIPAIVLSQLPEPTDIHAGGDPVPPTTTEPTQEFDLRKSARSFAISSSTAIAIVIGDNNVTYSDLQIIVSRRSTPLTIEFQNVRAVGRNGILGSGSDGAPGSPGMPLIYMDNNARVPDLTIVSSGGMNELYGGKGGNGSYTRTGGKGGNGGPAILADKITITGSANIVLRGGNGGKGGDGIDNLLSHADGGNGGNGGVSINANDITINLQGIVYALRSDGGGGGRSGTIWGTPGKAGSQGAQFTSTPRILDGVVLERR
jgi:hypothetical protein